MPPEDDDKTTEDAIDKTQTEQTQDKLDKPKPQTKEDSYFKRQFEKINAEHEKLKRQNMTAEEKIRDEKKSTEDRALAAENRVSELEFKQQFTDIATKAGVKNVKIAMLLAREDGVKYENGTVIGAERFLKQLRTESPELFAVSGSGGGRTPINGSGADVSKNAGFNAEIRRRAGY